MTELYSLHFKMQAQWDKKSTRAELSLSVKAKKCFCFVFCKAYHLICKSAASHLLIRNDWKMFTFLESRTKAPPTIINTQNNMKQMLGLISFQPDCRLTQPIFALYQVITTDFSALPFNIMSNSCAQTLLKHFHQEPIICMQVYWHMCYVGGEC